MKIVILCTLFVTIFGRHLGGDRDRVSIRDLGPVIEAYPQELNIQLNSRSGEWKVLNLRRRDSLNLDAPVYTTDEDGKVKRLPIRDLDSKAYQDVENGGAFLVKSERSESGLYRRNIRGILDDGDYEILLEPAVKENDASLKRSVDGKVEHTMIRRKIDRRYIDDGGLVYTEQPPIDKRFGHDDPVIVDRRSEPNITIDRRTDKPLYTVELLVVVDYEAYIKRFSTVDKVKEYYSQMVVGVDLRYANIKSDFQITVKLAGFFFMDEAYKSTITSDYLSDGELQSSDSLSAFGKWRRDKISSLPSHDHAMLFSGYDFAGSTFGRAYRGTICSGDDRWATSIIQEYGMFNNLGTAAHELGHCLGSKHDGNDNKCNPGDSFIMGHPSDMSEAAGKNPYNFSPCSIAQFQATIKDLNEKGKNCMENAAKSADPQVIKPPGQVWGVDEQCSWVAGDGAKYLAGGTFDHESICKRVRCSTPNSTYPWFGLPALRGTTCGNKKWCLEGDCVYDEMAPSAPAGNCTFGDATYPLNGLSCSQMVSQRLSQCYYYEKNCCESCPAHKLTDAPKGCEYGDKADWCKEVQTNPSLYCQSDAYLTYCCKSCGE